MYRKTRISVYQLILLSREKVNGLAFLQPLSHLLTAQSALVLFVTFTHSQIHSYTDGRGILLNDILSCHRGSWGFEPIYLLSHSWPNIIREVTNLGGSGGVVCVCVKWNNFACSVVTVFPTQSDCYCGGGCPAGVPQSIHTQDFRRLSQLHCIGPNCLNIIYKKIP